MGTERFEGGRGRLSIPFLDLQPRMEQPVGNPNCVRKRPRPCHRGRDPTIADWVFEFLVAEH